MRVNLPLSYLANDPSLLEELGKRGIAPELGLDALALTELSDSWHEELANHLALAELIPSIHLPFFDLRPASPDELILAATRLRLKGSFEVAMGYKPDCLVGHAGFDPALHQGDEEKRRRWLDESLATWKVLEDIWPDHPPLYLENTRESDPTPLVRLLDHLTDHFEGSVGICFDVGHWFSFAGGARKEDILGDLDRWLETLGPYIGHLHLHDNSGEGDEHLGLGEGEIPLDSVLESLTRQGRYLGENLSWTLEPHTKDALETSLAWLEERNLY